MEKVVARLAKADSGALVREELIGNCFCGTESRLRRGVKGGRKISANSVSPTCFGLPPVREMQFVSFLAHDLRSPTAERKSKKQMGQLAGAGQDRFYSANDSSGQNG